MNEWLCCFQLCSFPFPGPFMATLEHDCHATTAYTGLQSWSNQCIQKPGLRLSLLFQLVVLYETAHVPMRCKRGSGASASDAADLLAHVPCVLQSCLVSFPDAVFPSYDSLLQVFWFFWRERFNRILFIKWSFRFSLWCFITICSLSLPEPKTCWSYFSKGVLFHAVDINV